MITSLFFDNPKTQQREVWQQGELVYSFTNEEVAKSHEETKGRIKQFGHYGTDPRVLYGVPVE